MGFKRCLLWGCCEFQEAKELDPVLWHCPVWPRCLTQMFRGLPAIVWCKRIGDDQINSQSIDFAFKLQEQSDSEQLIRAPITEFCRPKGRRLELTYMPTASWPSLFPSLWQSETVQLCVLGYRLSPLHRRPVLLAYFRGFTSLTTPLLCSVGRRWLVTISQSDHG